MAYPETSFFARSLDSGRERTISEEENRKLGAEFILEPKSIEKMACRVETSIIAGKVKFCSAKLQNDALSLFYRSAR